MKLITKLSGTIIFKDKQKMHFGAIILDNIEALAADEQNVPTNCWGSGSVDCPVTKVKVEYVATGYSLEK